MKSSRSKTTVVIGHPTTSPKSTFGYALTNLTKSPFALRIRAIQWALLAIFAAALAGSLLLCCVEENTFDAVSVVKLPVPFNVSDKKLLDFGSGLLYERGVLVGKFSSVRATTIAANPLTVSILASSDSRANAIRLSNAAAIVAVNQDLPFWSRTLLRDDSDADDLAISYGMPHIAHHAALVKEPSGAPFVQTTIRWKDANEVYAAIWLAVMGVFAGAAYASSPVPRQVSKARQARRQIIAELKLQFSPDANADVDVPSSDDLRVIAGVELVPDLAHLSSTGAPRVTPILLDTSSELWDAASDKTDGCEVVFIRSREATVGSRAAVLAIGRAFARRGLKAVMLDADVTASLSKRDEFGFPDDVPGLLDILTQEASLSTCLLEEEEYPGLSGISAGIGDVSDGDADVLIESATMLDLLEYLGERNDIVLIHGPCGLDAGAATLAKRAGATILVGPEERTTLDIRAERRALVNLAGAEANILGRIEISRQDVPSTQIAI